MVQTHKRNSKAGFTKSRVQIISKKNNKTLLLNKKSNSNVKYVSANKTRKNNSKNKYRKIKSLKGGSYSVQSFQQVIKHFWYKNWSVNGLPGDIEQFKSFLMLCYNDIKKNNGTTIIHDVLSVGRSGVMYILLNVMFNPMYSNEDGTRKNDITPDTILDMIKEARTKRLCIVENIKQFMFICQMLGIPSFDDIIKKMLENDTAQFTYDLKAKKYTLKITKNKRLEESNIEEDLHKYIKMYFDLNKDNCTGTEDKNYAIVEAARYKFNKIDANINASNMTEFNNNKNIRVIIAKCAQTNDEKQLFNKMLNDDTNVKRIIMLSTQNELNVSEVNIGKTIINYIDNYNPYIYNPKLEKEESIVISNLELMSDDVLTYKGNVDLEINPIQPPFPTPRQPIKSTPPPLPPITNSERQKIIARLKGDTQEVSPQLYTKQETPIPPPPPFLTIPPPPPFLTIPPPPPQNNQPPQKPIPAPRKLHQPPPPPPPPPQPPQKPPRTIKNKKSLTNSTI